MASSQEFRNYILGGCPGLTARAMMGEYLLYYLGKHVGGVYDNRLLVKPIDAACAVLPGAPREVPYEGAKEMLLVEETDDLDLLRRLFDAMYAALPEPAPRNGEKGETHMTEHMIASVEETIGYHFRNPALLRQAFTRSSYVNELAQGGRAADTQSNEVLEFFGDSVLSAMLAYLLLERYGEIGRRGLVTRFSEKDFSIIRSNMSDGHALADAVRRLGVNRYLRLSRGDINQNVLEQDSPNEDLFESIIAAVALDCGMDFSVILDVVRRLDDVDRLLDRRAGRVEKDPKSAVKEWCEKRHIGYDYEVVGTDGPEHAKTFHVRLTVEGYPPVEATGTSRPKAEKAAAAQCLPMLTAEGDGSTPTDGGH